MHACMHTNSDGGGAKYANSFSISLVWFLFSYASMFITFFAVYVHTFCNLIGVWKFLNRDKPDVHDSPDPFFLF